MSTSDLLKVARWILGGLVLAVLVEMAFYHLYPHSSVGVQFAVNVLVPNAGFMIGRWAGYRRTEWSRASGANIRGPGWPR